MQTDTKFTQWENKTYFLYLEKACDNLCSSFHNVCVAQTAPEKGTRMKERSPT